MKESVTEKRRLSLFKGVLMLMLLGLMSLTVSAQNAAISGKVLDENGEALPGASVVEKGTTNGTTTDVDGNFNLPLTTPTPTLLVSFIGFQQQSFDVGNRSNLTITLKTDMKALQEVVVVGYGTQKKATLTGAVEQVNAEAFQSQAINSPVVALQGQTPGLLVQRNSGRVGFQGNGESAGEVSIRGVTSINGGNVLYVIDGVISSATEFYNINPNDIESVSVLKDGAAAIYGSRAANGVLVINTKKGSGKMSVEYNGSYRLKSIGIQPPAPSMQEYASVFLDAVRAEGRVDADGNSIIDYKQWGSEQTLLDMIDGKSQYYTTAVSGWGDNGRVYMAPANRFDEMYGDAHSFQHNLSISGSTEKTRYRLSGNFSDDVGALKLAYDGQKQYTFRLNLDQELTDWLSLDVGVSHQTINQESPSSGWGWTAIGNDPPVFPAYNSKGQWYANFGIGNRNATGSLVDGGKEESTNNITKINLGFTARILEGLDFRLLASIRNSDQEYKRYTLDVPLYTWEGDFVQSANPNPSVEETRRSGLYELYNSYLTYTKTLGDGHNFKVMGGITAELDRTSQLQVGRQNIEDLGIYNVFLANGNISVGSGNFDRNSGFYSYMSRANYDYKGRYLLEVLGRSDASSRFADGYKWQSYFGGSAGWVITEENFFEKNPILSFLKLKASYAQMGSTAGIGNHDYVSTIGFGLTPFGYSPALQPTARVGAITTNERTWERVAMTNLGTEFSLLDHKLSGSFDYFIKDNPNMLASKNYWAIIGGEEPTENIGHLRTQGWEAVLGWQDQIGEVRYGVSVNMGDARNELISLEGAGKWVAGLNDPSAGNMREGYPLNSYWMYETAGFFQSQEEVNAYLSQYEGGELPKGNATLRPGDVIKVDRDGNGVIRAVSEEGGDLKYMGDAAPHYYYGFNSNLSWKGIDLTANFYGVLQQNIERVGHLAYPFRAHWANQTPQFLGKTWTEDNPGAEFPRATIEASRANYNWASNDYRLQNNRYLRLKTLIVGYTLPAALTSKIHTQSIRIYFSGNDLWEATSLDDGYDPEMSTSATTVYPFMRSYAFGISAKF
ncbi:TonB-dependent receptor [Pontibacter sp. E15-1]|uniref:SusC/RagA family TonB-linked outer membrane protein n=1 Tax=Pontibacter sp. E15-1 TaxID=2919918 RepID=UPI001F4FE403|nr:TonB-dependent receptor [Pontibacter sp. E15-1]MCJ8165732.1 TonB-dependent receptor [Pontibacter sp. E15-1]